MTTTSEQHFNSIAKYLHTPLGKISKKNNVYIRVNKDKSILGSINILFSLLEESESLLKTKDILDDAQVYQWLEYALVYVGNTSSNEHIQGLLQELNIILSTRTYLVGDRFTIADVFLYYLLVKIMSGLSSLDKEKYLNVSRWFDNLQQDKALRQNNKFVSFDTNYLANIVPARH